MRTMFLAAIPILVAFSGCVEEPVAATGPDALLVRAFLEDGEAVVRFAAMTGTTVHPFQGTVDVLLIPEEETGWLPNAWTGRVWPHQFQDAVLPYFEFTQPIDSAREGDTVRIDAEARLPDGRLIRGHYVAVF